jgi:Uma2 family endonuclease
MISPLATKRPQPNLLYPDDDGQPMADNTLQYQWIVTIKDNLEDLFADRDDVFVAGNLLWYAVEGRPEIRLAPDALVVFGRPKGYRGSYMQWEEDGVPPTVVFEILSPNNRPAEMTRKFQFYDRHGVEEYYLYDPETNDLDGWRRVDDTLEEIAAMDGWTSPRLGIRFGRVGKTLQIFRPDGEEFLTFVQQKKEYRLAQEQLRQQAEANARAQEQLRQQVEANAKAQEQLRQQADELARLRLRLEALGENVDGA